MIRQYFNLIAEPHRCAVCGDVIGGRSIKYGWTCGSMACVRDYYG